MTERLRIRVHLLGGQSMDVAIDSSDEPEEYAKSLASRLTSAGRQFISIGHVAFHTNAIAGFDVDTL